MNEQMVPEPDDEFAIRDLLDVIDEALLDADDLDEVTELTPEDLDRAYTEVLRRFGKTRPAAGTVPPTDDLEWEHFALIATASFGVDIARDPNEDVKPYREVRLSDREIITALGYRKRATGRLTAPILRLERGEKGTSARLIGQDAETEYESIRVRVTIDDAMIDLLAEDGTYSGETSAILDPKTFSAGRISVSVLRR